MQVKGKSRIEGAAVKIKARKNQSGWVARRQAMRIKNSSRQLSREEIILCAVDMLADEAGYLDGVVEIGHPARDSVANLAYVSELLRGL